ncbi:ATPase with role in protein import into the ER [Ceratobasidium sp. UAMH 11750]|nr:ATPase with role in protein import into the ER [Ceratobasidium sp. UAMH 11750]
MRVLALLCALALGSWSSQTTGSESVYGTVIGIDLGTTYSCIGVYQGSRVDIIPNDQGNRITPSWVAFTEHEQLSHSTRIGDTAKHAFHTNPSQTVFNAKRLIGRHFDDVQLHEDIWHWPFKIVDNNGRPAVEVFFQGSKRIFTPQEISAMTLSKLKETAEAYLGHRVTHAVVTVPAYFNDEQRQATKDAGQIAGLDVLRMLNELTAAAIAYGLDKKAGDASRMIVYDLGGGTFNVSLLQMKDGAIKVLATAGDTHLGGEDFDNRVIDYFVARYQKDKSTNISRNRRAMSKLKREVEKAKRTLSSQLTVKLDIESFEGGNDFSTTLTRAKFEELNRDLFRRTLDPVTKVLQDKHLYPKDIDDASSSPFLTRVVLVGGSTRIPAIRQLLQNYFEGLEPRMGINPDEAVAYGAAIQGSILAGVTPFSDAIYVDVCPFTLGIKTTGGVFSQLIARNTQIPIQKSEIFSTAADNQRTVLIQVLQGNSIVAKDNSILGTFKLTGIPPSAHGVPQIKVTFDVDANGILKVTASDKDSGKSESIVIDTEKNQLQEKIAAKYAELTAQEPEAHNPVTRTALNKHSSWAESSGESASLAELESRIEEVSPICTDYEDLSVKPEAATHALDNPSIGVLPSDAVAVSSPAGGLLPIFREEL